MVLALADLSSFPPTGTRIMVTILTMTLRG